LTKKNNIPVIEDAAQAVGSLYKNKPSGSLGDVGCFSSHPLKNLNACGDGGYMTTNNFKTFQKAKSLVNHGIEKRNIIKILDMFQEWIIFKQLFLILDFKILII